MNIERIQNKHKRMINKKIMKQNNKSSLSQLGQKKRLKMLQSTQSSYSYSIE